jgi:hypothetical protein
MPPWIEELEEALAHEPMLVDVVGKGGIPPLRTVYNWIETRPDIEAKVARARAIGAQRTVKRIVTTAVGPVDEHGRYDASQDSAARVARDRLLVDTLRWLAGVHDPATYGDARHANAAGSIVVNVVTGVPHPAPDRPSARQRIQVSTPPDSAPAGE